MSLLIACSFATRMQPFCITPRPLDCGSRPGPGDSSGVKTGNSVKSRIAPAPRFIPAVRSRSLTPFGGDLEGGEYSPVVFPDYVVTADSCFVVTSKCFVARRATKQTQSSTNTEPLRE